jgi:capsular exopolysaccharide synthesis family protein
MTGALNPQSDDDRDRALELLKQQRELLRMEDLAAERIRDPDDEDAIDFRRYWFMLLRRKWIVLAVVFASTLVALVHAFNTTPMYRSTLVLQIEPQGDQFLEYQSNVSLGEPAWDWNYYQTQYELLRSRSLARRVIDQLGLEAAVQRDGEPVQEDPSFLAELKSGIGGLIGRAGSGPPAGTADPAPANAKPNLEGALLASLTVSPVPDSRLVHIHYDSADPREAAAVANAFADNFVNMTLERRYDATGYAKKFLEERIEQVRANLEDSERRLVAYARDREIVDLEDKLGNLMQTLTAMSQALVQAETERIGVEAEYTQSLGGKGPSVLKVLDSEVIQALKTRKGELELTYQEQLKTYKPGYPKMQQIRRQIAEIDQQIKGEIAAITEAVKAQYAAKVEEQATLQTRVSEIKTEILDLQNRSTDYQALKREVDTNRELYDGLLQRMKEVGVVAGISTNNISIVDRAQVPGAPYKPDLNASLSRAALVGLIAGILLAFLFEYLDDTVKTREDLENRAHVPVLGAIPKATPSNHGIRAEEVPLLAASDPKSPVAEAVRSLRTSLVFSTADGAPKIMHVTSSGPGEGKTTAATNIAISFAQAGGKVLIIDADLRAPSLHGAFSLPNHLGLTNYLAGDTKPADIAQPTRVARLFAMTSGPLPPNPVELLSSAKMLDLLSLASERFDFVVLDGPPVIGLADALVLSKISRGTMLIVEAGRTRYGQLDGAVKRLRAANTILLGAVLSKFSQRGAGYGYGYEYHYDYDYGHGDAGRTTALPEKA